MLIWGRKGYSDHLGYIIFECPECGTTGPFSVHQLRKKFTLYFVPTFSYSNKQYLECESCHAAFEVPKKMKKELADSIMSQDELSALVASVARDRQRGASMRTPRTDPAYKHCPYCAEDIRAEAVYCRFCQRDL